MGKYLEIFSQSINVLPLFQFVSIIGRHHCWSYADAISVAFYKPTTMFKIFSFVHLFYESEQCAYTSTCRFQKSRDPFIVLETSTHSKPSLHVLTMDVSIIQHKELRHAFAQGLNHILLKPTLLLKL
jgi:hypothetical protein